ncbi:four-jointed box protein 1-like [Asterias rubens]|uniref:four-jointed box protein 1-like n=1 Tax=Asterias rubens TaxID=7604 RepID=UPI0014553AFC|nr:four-jointed box protein 1-like [Asterias rubens]
MTNLLSIRNRRPRRILRTVMASIKSARCLTIFFGLLVMHFLATNLSQSSSAHWTTSQVKHYSSGNSSEHNQQIPKEDSLDNLRKRVRGSNPRDLNHLETNKSPDAFVMDRLHSRNMQDGIDTPTEGAPWTRGGFWSEKAEATVSIIQGENSNEFAEMIKDNLVVNMVPGCGHSQNRLLTLQNGCRVCCRYRNSLDLILGEMYAYYLSQVLHVHNLPPTTLGVINATDSKWDAVRTNMTIADWSASGHQVVFSQWIPKLAPALLPQVFLKQSKRLHPRRVIGMDAADVAELVQWSELIIFDYLTGNMDRMVSMLVNKQWNSQIMESPVHNLEKSTLTGQLFFIDNELSFIHSYRLLDRYGHYHTAILQYICIFRLQTIERLQRLHRDGDIWDKMMDFADNSQGGNKKLPKLSRKNVGILKMRLVEVLNHVENCKKLYLNSDS